MSDADHLLDLDREIVAIENMLTDFMAGDLGPLVASGAAGDGETALLDREARAAALRENAALWAGGGFTEINRPMAMWPHLFAWRSGVAATADELGAHELDRISVDNAIGESTPVVVDGVQQCGSSSSQGVISRLSRMERHDSRALVGAGPDGPSVEHELLASGADDLRLAELTQVPVTGTEGSVPTVIPSDSPLAAPRSGVDETLGSNRPDSWRNR